MRLGQTVMSQENKIDYSKLAQNLQNYSRSKSGVEVTDQHYENYERIRKSLKRKRMTPFKFFSKKELDEPSRQPITIDHETFKRYLESLCKIENFESFIQPLKNGRQINFMKFCHKIGYLAIDQFEASSPMKRAGASIDLNKSNLFGASQNFANRQELKRNFYSEFYKSIKSQESKINLDALFAADDTRDTGLTSKVLFVKRIQTTMYKKDTQSLFKADTIGFISEQFRVEKSDKIAYRGFIKKVREREAQILTIYGFFQQFYKTMVGKNYTQLYDIFKDYDNSKQRSQRKFNEKQIAKLLTENKIQFGKRDVQVFVLEFRIPDTTYAEFQKIENSFLQWSKMVGKVIKTVRISPKQIVKDYFQKLRDVLQNQNTTIKRLFNSKVYITGYQMLQKVVSFPSQDCQTLVEQFDTQGRKQASLAQIIRKYNIHFGIKNDTTQQVLKKQLIVKAMDFICRLCLKEGIIIKDIFKPYELKNAPGKCNRMDFTNVLQNKLKLKKEASIETIQYIISDSQQTVGISVEDFQNRVYKRAYASNNQQKLYAKINRAVSKNKINLQSQFRRFQLEEGFIQESALVELVSTFNLKLQKQEIQLLIQNVQKNRSGNSYNWRSINLLIYIQSQKPRSKQEKKQSSRQKTMRFLSAYLDEAKKNRGKNDIGMVIQDYYQKNYKKGFKMDLLCKYLADISSIEIDRIQTLITRYKSPKNDQISDQFFQDVRNFERGNFDKDEQGRLKDSLARADTIQVDYKNVLEAITSHTVKNSLSIYGAFNAVDKKKTGMVKSQNEFAKCLQSFVPPNIKIQELKQLAKKYAKNKHIDYQQFFADFNALKQIYHSQNQQQTFFVDKSPLPSFDEESKRRTEFQFPNSPQAQPPPPPQQSQEFRRIFAQLSKHSMNQGIGLQEVFRKFIIPKTKVFPRRQLEQYMERQGNYSDQMIRQFIQHIEETQDPKIDRGNIDFHNFFIRVYAIKSPVEQTEKFFRKMKDHLSRQA